MSETEIALAKAYLARSGQDPIAALIRSVRDIAAMRRLLGGRRADDAAWASPRDGVPLAFPAQATASSR